MFKLRTFIVAFVFIATQSILGIAFASDVTMDKGDPDDAQVLKELEYFVENTLPPGDEITVTCSGLDQFTLIAPDIAILKCLSFQTRTGKWCSSFWVNKIPPSPVTCERQSKGVDVTIIGGAQGARLECTKACPLF